MSAQITIISGPDAGRAFALAAGSTLQVGRSQTTATKLNDATVSRLHCEITYDGSVAVLVNHSGSGTMVNGLRATQAQLHHGDVVRIGGTEFRFHLAAMEDSETLMQQPGTMVHPPPPKS